MALAEHHPEPPRQPNALADQVGSRIRAIRKSRGMRLKDIADLVGTTPQTLQRLETGRMTLTVQWVEAICQALQVEPDTLFSCGRGALTRANDAALEAQMELAALRGAVRKLCELVGVTVPDGAAGGEGGEDAPVR